MELFYFYAVVIAAFGAIIGSFLNAIIWRWPQEKTLSGRSVCLHCEHELSASDLVPILSYIVLRGKCRYCKKNIPPRYFLVELITSTLFVLSWFELGAVVVLNEIWFSVLFGWFVIAFLVAIFVIDLEHYLILDKMVLPGAVIIILMRFAESLWSHYVHHAWNLLWIPNIFWGIIIGSLPFYLLWKISKEKWIGLGDAKLGIFLGAALGFPGVLIAYFLGFFLGTLVSVPLLLFGKKQLTSKLPLGTFLAVGGVVTLLFGQQILEWYLGLLRL